MANIKALSKNSFEEKQLAEQKGGLYKYWQYKEGSKMIVVRIYSDKFAVDYYAGPLDMEDSDFGSYSGDMENAWPVILKLANKYFKQYQFTGEQPE